ncbi:hypothetical protein GGS23DRAFT_362979 [Durotheca rogersii]|uniref:uncharacterized protein n=1 Tax=Durotheca rogersii TaxID=419775 RepID=UPI00221E9953|nr:uncharacterized protein GGS23DRAFT_362979 [Durotheca rogersii]KAI5865974.1 hypothetical protein GGS23DRAFT_362979 [Durotheca rogersii]
MRRVAERSAAAAAVVVMMAWEWHGVVYIVYVCVCVWRGVRGISLLPWSPSSMRAPRFRVGLCLRLRGSVTVLPVLVDAVAVAVFDHRGSLRESIAAAAAGPQRVARRHVHAALVGRVAHEDEAARRRPRLRPLVARRPRAAARLRPAVPAAARRRLLDLRLVQQQLDRPVVGAVQLLARHVQPHQQRLHLVRQPGNLGRLGAQLRYLGLETQLLELQRRDLVRLRLQTPRLGLEFGLLLRELADLVGFRPEACLLPIERREPVFELPEAALEPRDLRILLDSFQASRKSLLLVP